MLGPPGGKPLVRVGGPAGALIDEVDGLRAEAGDDNGELADIMATMAVSCAPFNQVTTASSTSTAPPGGTRARA